MSGGRGVRRGRARRRTAADVAGAGAAPPRAASAPPQSSTVALGGEVPRRGRPAGRRRRRARARPCPHSELQQRLDDVAATVLDGVVHGERVIEVQLTMKTERKYPEPNCIVFYI